MSEEKHVSPETLLAYHERTLSEAEVDRVQEHLAECPECTAVVLDLASFPDLAPPTEEHRLTPADLRQQWGEIERRISERRPVWQRHQVLLPVAALFFVAAVGLALWGQGLRAQLRDDEGPNGNVQLVEAVPITATSRGPAAPKSVPDSVRSLAVVLDAGSADRYPSYTLDLRSAGGAALVSGLDIRRDASGLFTVIVPRHLLAPGTNRAEIFGEGLGERVSIAEFVLSLDS